MGGGGRGRGGVVLKIDYSPIWQIIKFTSMNGMSDMIRARARTHTHPSLPHIITLDLHFVIYIPKVTQYQFPARSEHFEI